MLATAEYAQVMRKWHAAEEARRTTRIDDGGSPPDFHFVDEIKRCRPGTGSCRVRE